MRRRLTARLAVVIGLGAIAAMVAMGGLALAVGSLRDSAREAQRNQRVITGADRIQILVIDAETAVRGYAITGRSSFLAPLQRARDALPGTIAQLRALTAGHSGAAEADELSQLVRDYINEFAVPTADAAERDLAAGRRAIEEGGGRRRVDEIRLLIGRVVTAAQQRTAERDAAADRRAAVALTIAGIVGVASLLLGGALLSWLHGSVARPLGRGSRAATQVGGGDLGQRWEDDRRPDEIGQLATAFNEMVVRLRDSSIELEQQHAELESQNAELERQAVELERQAAELERQTRELEDRHGEVTDVNARLRERGAELERLAGDLRAAHERTALLARAAERATTVATVEARAEVVLDAALELSGGTIGAVWARRSVDDRRLALVATRGLDEAALPGDPAAAASAAGRALDSGAPVEVGHDGGDLRLRSFGRELTLRRELHLPLLHGGQAVGVVSIGCTHDGPWRPEELEALEALSEQAAVFFDNAAQTQAARWLADVNRSVLDATGEAIHLIAPDGRTLLVNQALQEFARDIIDFPTGQQPPPHVDAIADYVALRTTDPEAFRARWREIKDDPTFEGDDEYQFSDSGRWFHRYTAPVHSADGRLIGRIFVTRDVTEQREAQRTKDELMATVSHELRTPLAAIIGFTELLTTRTYPEAERQEYLQTIGRQASRLSALVDDFLDLQTLESGGRPIEIGEFDLAALLAEEAEFFSHQSQRHTLAVDTPSGGLTVAADGARLRRAVANLLSNAIKYSPEGGAVNVSAHAHNGRVEVAVTDEGIGVPDGARQHLFERFYRVDNSETSEIGGTGLGLALVREVVEAHGGEVGVESREGGGSRFWFAIPREAERRPAG